MYDGATTLSGTFRGRGTVFDGIGVSGGIPNINRNAGGESQVEGLWAMILAKDAIAHYGLDPTFAFETGASAAAPPIVNSSSYDFDAAQPTLRFAFNQNVGASLDAFDLSVVNTATNQPIPIASFGLTYNSALRELSVTFPGLAGGVIPDGAYRATIIATGIAGASGNPMAANYNLDFFVLAADANHDGVVNALDFNALATNFGGPSPSFSGGDFNYDGQVNTLDFAALAQRFGRTVPIGAAPLTMPAAVRTLMFSTRSPVASLWGNLDDNNSSTRDFADIEN
jgi:hypothetical protein